MDKNIFTEIKTLFEDEDILAIDKPSGLVVHSDERTIEVTLSDWLEQNHPEIKNIGRPHTLDNERYLPRYGMLSRLDRDTSGVILIAKNEEFFDFLQKQFLDNSVQKEYIAIVEGDLESEINNLISENKITEVNQSRDSEKFYRISAPIGRSKVDPRKWTSGDDIRNTKREAITEFQILGKKNLGDKTYSTLQIFPKTGRTHQIRVHLFYLGFSILGEKMYKKEDSKKNNLDNLNKTNILLHAKSVEFIHPKNGKTKIESETPNRFIDYL